MNSKLAVDEHNELIEIESGDNGKEHIVLRLIAKFISYVFHPLFIPVYLCWFLVRIQPYLFSSFTEADKSIVIIRFAVMYTVFPLATVLIAKALGFIDSIQLKTQKDRIIPYIACGLYYFWMWYVLRNQLQFPPVILSMSMAIFIASSLGLMANIYNKVSMHAMAMGVMVAFMFGLALTQNVSMGLYLTISIVIAGAVCTARLINRDHNPFEVYFGLIIGILSQIVAFIFA
jgi:hypothetical protein